MRDIALFILIFATLPFIFKRPAIGVLMFAWVSLMNPHRLTYGAAYDFPFAMLLSAVTLLGMLRSAERKELPMTPVIMALLSFWIWMTLTSFTALEPDLVWKEWNRVFKTFTMTIVTILVLRTEQEIKALAWVAGMSLGFFGAKGGVFTIKSGGSSHVFGPEGSYITDNNALALAMLTALPLIYYVTLSATNKWVRHAATGVTVLTVAAAAGSYSRGALLGGGCMLFFLWLKSRQKIRTGIALALVAPLIYMVMPDKWFGRMETIDNYQEDASAMGRINAWYFAYNVAVNNPMGGGYHTFTWRQFAKYAPDPLDHHAAHSIYFQVLGEHGFIGLGLFLLVMFLAWRNGTRVIAFCKGKGELKWASDLAAMCQVSIIGYAVGGAFLTLAYYDLYYYIIAILVLLDKLLILPSRARPALRARAGPDPGLPGRTP